MNGTDYTKIGKGMLIAMGGAGLTYLLGVLDAIDVQITTPAIVALLAALINAARIYLRSINGRKNSKN